ncbi:MAG: tRNA (N(6)-L-threonylcarbamoyladenosine(37)-C(2))-methylthiotransferase [Methanomicrobium sp.]|nr:tRNA (N(6)-L-threonylcarbamoyladenosine(37)-C(2))-methylthiotransferase [Methanomicrobium sp.]
MQTLRNKSVFFETYGCTFNFADTEKIKEIAAANGCLIAQSPEDADAVVINTCTVVSQTERAMIRAINDYADKEVYVTGCMPVVQREKLLALRPDIHLIMPDEIYENSERVGAVAFGSTGIVQVGTGCLGACAYCITRFARGRLRSFGKERIIAEIERQVAGGVTEIQLTGQDVSAWGADIGSNLGELLTAVNEVDGNFAVRVGMMNPATVMPHVAEIAEAFTLEKIYAFIHLPVQSGSDRVLETMNRGYTRRQFIDVVGEFRRRIPDARISTDFIVGYPTETEEDFNETLSLIEEVKPTKVNITRFSLREGTPAAKYYDMPDWIKKNRSRKLTDAANAIYDANNAAMIGRTVHAAVTEKKTEGRMAGTVVARDRFYNNIVVKEDLPLGKKLDLRIVDHHRHYLIAETL